MVSIGRRFAMLEEIKAPSPRTTIKGAVMPISCKISSARPINLWVKPIKRAFRTAVSARLGPFNFEDR